MSMTRRRLLDDTYKQTAVGNPIQVRSVARMRPEITMQGWTEQAQYEGKNLFDAAKAKQLDSWIGTGVYRHFDIQLKPNTTYTLFVSQNNMYKGYKEEYDDNFALYLGESENTANPNERFGNSSSDLKPLTFYTFTTTEVPYYINLYVNSWSEENLQIVFDELLVNMMLVEGSSVVPYEPYTGGAPSPSPDYPQEIVSAGDYNEETDKYEYEIKVTGKNILSIPDITPSTPERTIACNITRDITISAQEVPISISSNIWRLWMKYLDGTLLYFADVDFLSLKPKTFYASEENPIIAITYRETYITEGRYGGVQVEYGTSATEYQPFTEQTITLTSDRPLTEWDRLEKRDGVWGWVYGSDIVEFDGSEDEAWVFSNTYGGMFYTKKYDAVKGKAYCDKYMYVGAVSDEFSTGIFSIGLGVYPNSIWLKNVDIPNIQTLKSTLAENPITMVYQTSTEAFVPLTETEQAALNALHTNYPTTVLTNGQNCGMTITYKTRKSLEANQ